jgi:hypothetical protein
MSEKVNHFSSGATPWARLGAETNASTLQENKCFATLLLRPFEYNCRNVNFVKHLQRFIRRFLQVSQCFVPMSGKISLKQYIHTHTWHLSLLPKK